MNAQPDEPITEEQVDGANEEAPELEPEQPPDGEPTPEPAPEPEPEPEQETSALMEERFKKQERAWKTYVAALGRIFEEQATELVDCPLCAGGVNGYLHMNDAGHVADETKKAVLTFMGVTQEADYRDDPHHSTCPDCNGQGKVKSGSQVANYKLLPCAKCRGAGYVPPPGVNVNGEVTATPVLAAVGGGDEYVPTADADPWGSPRLLADGLENPNYGKMPQFKDKTLP